MDSERVSFWFLNNKVFVCQTRGTSPIWWFSFWYPSQPLFVVLTKDAQPERVPKNRTGTGKVAPCKSQRVGPKLGQCTHDETACGLVCVSASRCLLKGPRWQTSGKNANSQACGAQGIDGRVEDANQPVRCSRNGESLLFGLMESISMKTN